MTISGNILAPGGYVRSGTFQHGLDAPPPNAAPVVDGLAEDASTFILGMPVYVDAGALAEVYDADSPSFDGGNLTVRQLSGSADGGFSFDTSVAMTQIRWSSGPVPDSGNDGAHYTPAHALAVGDRIWYSSGTSPDPANWILAGTVVQDGQGGHDLQISFSDTSATIPSGPGGAQNHVALMLNYLMYSAPTLGERGFSLTVSDGDGATSIPVGFTMTGTADPTSTVTAANGVAEPVQLPADAVGAAAAVAVFDFVVTDTGSGDGLATRIRTLTLDTGGSGDFAKVTWLLLGPGIAGTLTGSYDAASHTLAFADAGIAVADGSRAVYTLKAYFADPADAVQGATYRLSIDGDRSVALEDALSSQMAGVQAPVSNGSGSVVVSRPTVLAVEHAVPAGAGPTDADTVSWAVRFSEYVQYLDASDFDVEGLSGETIAVAEGPGNTWLVSTSGGGLARLDGSITLALAAGHHIVNAAGQALESLDPSGADARTWVIHNGAPAAPGQPVLATDSGSSDSDNLTRIDTPTFSGSAAPGARVTLYDEHGAVLGTGAADAGGIWVITSSVLAPGAHAVSARAVDGAGNESAASGALRIVIDTAVEAPGLALASDTGAAAADGVTRDGRMTVTLAADADHWAYSVDGGANWTSGSGEAFTLAAGTYAAGSVQVRQADLAGNLSAAVCNAHSIVIDAAAPTVDAIVRPALAGPSGTAPFTVAVHYLDAGAGLDPDSIDTGDLAVSGAAGALHVAGASWNGATGIATYTVDAPAGGWSNAHAGSHAIALAAGAVRDLAGNALAAPAQAQFQVSFNAPPRITSNGGGAGAVIEIAEHRGAVTTVAAVDPDAGDTLGYSITGGADAALFTINGATGALSLRHPPSAAAPQDGDGDNSYLVEVGASDGHGGLATQALTVKVLLDTDGDGQADVADDDLDGDGRLNAAEDPVPNAIGSGSGSGDGNGDGIADSHQVNVASLGTVGQVAPALRYATIEVAPGLTLSGIGNSTAGVLPRNAKMPLGQFDFSIGGLAVGASVDVAIYVDKSLGANGYYKQVGPNWFNLATASTVGAKTKISFSLTDGGAYDADGIANGVIVDPGGVAVIAPRIVSAGGEPTATVTVPENGTAVLTVAAEAMGPVTYAISGGADAASFRIDPASGKLAFAHAPDFEYPADLGAGAGNNSYLVEVTASDAAGSDTQALAIVVRDLDETMPVPPAFDDDQFPDALEGAHGLTPGVKDNDVFGSNKLFVMELYRDLMFREAGAPEWEYWQKQLDAGRIDKAGLVSVFLDSAELQGGAGAVARVFYSALDRTPDRAGLVYWTQQLSAGEALRTVAGDIAASTEFTARYGQLDDAGFLGQLYRNVMDRPADAAGLAYWQAAMAAGFTRGDVLLGFAQSDEFKAASDHQVTTTLAYLGLLGRDAAPQEVTYWVGALDAGQAEVKVVGRFLAADEYHDRFLP